MEIIKPSLKDTPEEEWTLYFCDTHVQHSKREITSLSYLIAPYFSLQVTPVYRCTKGQLVQLMSKTSM